jgi:hypothetical protein
MIDGREPVPRLVGPVVAEERALAVAVRADAKARCRDACVPDRDLAPFIEASRRRSFLCSNASGAPPLDTEATVMPRSGVPAPGPTRSSSSLVTPSFRQRTSTVVSPAITSLASESVNRKT